MTITPGQITALEAMVNAIAGMFLPSGAVAVLKDAEIVFNILEGSNPITDPVLGGIITNHLGTKFGLYAVPMGAPGTTVTITF